MFEKDKKMKSETRYENRDLGELLSEFQNDITFLKSKVKKNESLRHQNMVLDKVISIMLENPDYADRDFYITFEKISMNINSKGFAYIDMNGKIVLLPEQNGPVYFDNLYSAATAYVNAIVEGRPIGCDYILKFKIMSNHKNKSIDGFNYRLTRTDDLCKKVYMYFEEDTNTPYYTSVESFAFIAPLEEIVKWKTPAWEIEEVPNEVD